MRRLGVLLGCASAVGVLLVAPGVGSAAQKTGCADGSSEWSQVSVGYATDRIWPGLLDTSPWGGDKSLFGDLVASNDKNGDGDVCLRVMWGEDRNPNSHWYKVGLEILGSPTEQYFVHDNHANGSR